MLLFFDLCLGPIDIKPNNILRNFLNIFRPLPEKDVIDTQILVLGNIRLPRMLLSMVIESILAVTEASIQELFRNSLAYPSIIEVFRGATLFAAIYIVLLDKVFSTSQAFWKHPFWMMLFTFTRALCTTLLVFSLSHMASKTNISLMLLAGIAG